MLQHIQELAAEEHRLFDQGSLSDADNQRLEELRLELDQCWDLLRQRQALRDAGKDPEQARVRPKEVVEKYEQ